MLERAESSVRTKLAGGWCSRAPAVLPVDQSIGITANAACVRRRSPFVNTIVCFATIAALGCASRPSHATGRTAHGAAVRHSAARRIDAGERQSGARGDIRAWSTDCGGACSAARGLRESGNRGLLASRAVLVRQSWCAPSSLQRSAALPKMVLCRL